MKKISIIGTGLIGGSLGLALRRKTKGKYIVTGIGRNVGKLKAAKRMGAVDRFTTEMKEGVKDADIIIICTPVHLIASLVKTILPFVKAGAVITDAGSAKDEVLKDVEKVFRAAKGWRRGPRNVDFIGAHPMAGSEKSGIKAARADMYEGASVVITKSKAFSKEAAGEIRQMWLSAGAKVIEMPACVHDRAVAMISHLPHVLAFSLSLLAAKLQKSNPYVSNLAAGSFRDLTRIAGSNPSDWASICGSNRKELSDAIDMLVKELNTVRGILRYPTALEHRFAKAKIARHKLLNNTRDKERGR